MAVSKEVAAAPGEPWVVAVAEQDDASASAWYVDAILGAVRHLAAAQDSSQARSVGA